MYYGIYPAQTSAMGDPDLSSLIVEAMRDEKHDRAKYKMMMDMAKDDKVRKQIEFAYEDEGKHYKMFKQIFCMLTGRSMDVPAPQVEHYNKLIDAVESSIDGELEAVELYRKIKSMLPNTFLRDMMYEIITDEQEHATRFTYIYAIMTSEDE